MTKIRELTDYLEKVAPLSYQESYDNSGLIYGNPDTEISSVLVSLDCTKEIVEEANEKGCNVIVSHHPLVFSGIKKLDSRNWVHETLMNAIRYDIAIYAIHTNLDNVLSNGVNQKIAEKLELEDLNILAPGNHNELLELWISELLTPNVESIIINSNLNVQSQQTHYNRRTGTQFSIQGESGKIQLLKNQLKQYKPIILRREQELLSTTVGSGIIGNFHYPMPEKQFLEHIVGKMSVSCIKHTQFLSKSISKVAVCGGSGRFLLEKAIRSGADAFITADFKYHDFFEANSKILVADIGHYESEQYTIELLIDIIREKFSSFASHYTDVNTNPVYYYG